MGFKEWWPCPPRVCLDPPYLSHPGPLLLPTFFLSFWIQIKKLHQQVVRDMTVDKSCVAPPRVWVLISYLNFILSECGHMSQRPRCWNRGQFLGFKQGSKARAPLLKAGDQTKIRRADKPER